MTKIQSSKQRLGVVANDWRIVTLENCCSKITDGTHKTPKYVDTGIKFISAKNIINGKINWDDVKYISKQEHETLIKRCNPEDRDIVLSKSGSLGMPAIINKTFEFSLFESLALIKYQRDIIDGGYLLQYLLSPLMKKIYHLETKGLSIKHLHLAEIRKFKIVLPKYKEQINIASILSTWDKAIELKKKLIEQKKEQKKGLMQNLLNGKVRLSGFDGEWKEIRIGNILKSKTNKTTQNNQHQILSCTKDGIILQDNMFNKQIASKNNIGYKIVKRNELVLSPMNLWLGGIDISDFEVGIVSPAYKVYEVNYNQINKHYLKSLLRSDYMIKRYKSISPRGASVVRRNLSIPDFENLKVNLPINKNERDKINIIIRTIDKELNLLEKELSSLKQQKKGLMQLLLTGKVRVNS